MRGPEVFVDGPGRRLLPDDRERFDRIVLDLVEDIEQRWSDRLGLVEYAVEDVPDLGPSWDGDGVPLAALVRGGKQDPIRLVLFRRPIEFRAADRYELRAAVLAVLAEQLADLLGVPAHEVHPGYGAD